MFNLELGDGEGVLQHPLKYSQNLVSQFITQECLSVHDLGNLFHMVLESLLPRNNTVQTCAVQYLRHHIATPLLNISTFKILKQDKSLLLNANSHMSIFWVLVSYVSDRNINYNYGIQNIIPLPHDFFTLKQIFVFSRKYFPGKNAQNLPSGLESFPKA